MEISNHAETPPPHMADITKLSAELRRPVIRFATRGSNRSFVSYDVVFGMALLVKWAMARGSESERRDLRTCALEHRDEFMHALNYLSCTLVSEDVPSHDRSKDFFQSMDVQRSAMLSVQIRNLVLKMADYRVMMRSREIVQMGRELGFVWPHECVE
jgi:hypothetical protein